MLGAAALTVPARGQHTSPAKPSIIDSTYVVTTFLGDETIHLYEENGRLRWDGKLRYKEKYRRNGSLESDSTHSVEYDKVNFVEYRGFLPTDRGVNIWVSDGTTYTVPVPAEAEGVELAEYVARKSPLGLELIGSAWRIRKHFQCPEGGQLGCRDFKDLLDHGDPDIAEYFYSQDPNTHTYACFRSGESFFVVQYEKLIDFGTFSFDEFENQQSARREYGEMHWFPNGIGSITEPKLEVKQGAKPQPLGSIDPSSLSYQTKFQNKLNTTTRYTLSVRWSTGHFTESYSFKDKKSEVQDMEQTGVCVKLN